MSQEKEHNSNFKAGDFERYYSGKMAAKEMHEMEKAALDDPFLADALEGYMKTKTPEDDIRDLQNRLIKKEREPKVIFIKPRRSFIILKIAAVLIVLAGFSWIIYNQDPVKKREIAGVKNEEAISAANSPANIQPSDSIKIKNNTEVGLQKSGKSASEEMHKNANEENIESSVAARIKNEKTDGDLTYEKTDASASNPVLTEPVTSTTDIILENKPHGLDVKEKHTIKGTVVDDAGKAVAFATIKDQKNNSTLSTDEHGSFLLKTNDSTALVAVNAVGYETKNTYLNAESQSNRIILQEADKHLNEVVVTSRGNTRQKESQQSARKSTINLSRISVKYAEPVKGWDDFNSYVNDAFKKESMADSVAVHGPVMVSFNVTDSGRAVNLKVEKSLSPNSDTQAIRMIQQGTFWKQKKKNKRAEVSIHF